MSKQLKLDNFRLPEVAIEEGECSPNAKVICGECGALMRKMGVNQTRQNKEDEIYGEWTFSCRTHKDGSFGLIVKKDGNVSSYDKSGSGHEIREIEDKKISDEILVDKENGKLSYVYPHEDFKDPDLWEEP